MGEELASPLPAVGETIEIVIDNSCTRNAERKSLSECPAAKSFQRYFGPCVEVSTSSRMTFIYTQKGNNPLIFRHSTELEEKIDHYDNSTDQFELGVYKATRMK